MTFKSLIYLGLALTLVGTGFTSSAVFAKSKPGEVSKKAFQQDGGQLLPVGMKAPDFNLPATGGKSVKLTDYRGKNLIVIFYPMDQTPGCTLQLCALRDEYKQFQALNAEGIASNPASVKSHEAFAKKQNYRFPILSDAKHEMAHAYGVEGPLGFNNRTVYIVDTQGVIRYAKRGLPSNTELMDAIRHFPPVK